MSHTAFTGGHVHTDTLLSSPPPKESPTPLAAIPWKWIPLPPHHCIHTLIPSHSSGTPSSATTLTTSTTTTWETSSRTSSFSGESLPSACEKSTCHACTPQGLEGCAWGDDKVLCGMTGPLINGLLTPPHSFCSCHPCPPPIWGFLQSQAHGLHEQLPVLGA